MRTRIFPVVDRNDNLRYTIVGKEGLHKNGRFHRKSSIIIETFGGGVMIAKAGPTSDEKGLLTFPVITFNRSVESYAQAAIAAAEEQLGLKIDKNELNSIVNCKPCNDTNNDFVHLFSYLIDPEEESIDIDNNSIEELRIVNRKILETDMSERKDAYSKTFTLLFNMFITLVKKEN